MFFVVFTCNDRLVSIDISRAIDIDTRQSIDQETHVRRFVQPFDGDMPLVATSRTSHVDNRCLSITCRLKRNISCFVDVRSTSISFAVLANTLFGRVRAHSLSLSLVFESLFDANWLHTNT
jgi:hypothetical protein